LPGVPDGIFYVLFPPFVTPFLPFENEKKKDSSTLKRAILPAKFVGDRYF